MIDSMTLMLPYRERRKFPDSPKSVPFSMLDEKMALQVHSQTLERLSGRGGLDPVEMLALMNRKNIFSDSVGGVRLYGMDIGFAIGAIKQMLEE